MGYSITATNRGGAFQSFTSSLNWNNQSGFSTGISYTFTKDFAKSINPFGDDPASREAAEKKALMDLAMALAYYDNRLKEEMGQTIDGNYDGENNPNEGINNYERKTENSNSPSEIKRISELTDPTTGNQGANGPIKKQFEKKITELRKKVEENERNLSSEDKKTLKSFREYRQYLYSKATKMYLNEEKLTFMMKQIKDMDTAINNIRTQGMEEFQINKNMAKGKMETFYQSRDALLNVRYTPDQVANGIASAFCFIETNKNYGNITNKDNRSRVDFFMEELVKGNIGTAISWRNGVPSPVEGIGGGEWMQSFGADFHGTRTPGRDVDKVTTADVTALNNSDAKVAIVNVNYDIKKGEYGTHWILIARDSEGNWVNMDHNPVEQRNSYVNFNYVYQFRY